MRHCVITLSVLILLGGTAFAQEMSGARVSPHWLETNLDMPNMQVVDLRNSIKDYWQGHVPGAVYLNPEALRLADNGTPAMVMPPAILAEMLGQMGINNNTMVIAYSQENDFNATYLAWALAWLGHERFGVLNGGFERWADDGHPVTQDYPEIRPRHYGVRGLRDEERASLQEVIADKDNRKTVLLDVRSKGLYTGKMGFWKRNGHIPGALHLFWVDNLRETGAWKSDDELRAMYEAIGVTPDKRIIVSCGQGLMSSQTWFALKHVLGFPHVENYDGSFSEWSNVDDLPVATGPNP